MYCVHTKVIEGDVSTYITSAAPGTCVSIDGGSLAGLVGSE